MTVLDHRSTRQPITGREGLLTCVGSLAVVGVTWLDTHLRGSVGIPRDDDWSYLRTVFTLAETGSFTLNGWVHMMFVGQAVPSAALVQLVGPSIVALQLANAMLAAFSLIIVYLIARQLLTPMPAAFVVMVLAVSPVFAHLVVTAMTDIPVLAFQACCLLFGMLMLARGRPHWPLALGVVITGLIAFTIREYGAVVLVVVAGILLVRFRRFRGFVAGLSGMLVVVGVAAVMLWLWRRGLTNDIVNTPLPITQALTLLCRGAATLALLTVPIWAATSWPGLANTLRRSPRWVTLFGAGLAVAIIAVVVATGNQVLGNIIHPFGSTWTSVGDGIRAMPLGLFRALQILGYLSLILLAVVTASAAFAVGSGLLRRSKQSLRTSQWQTLLVGLAIVGLLGSYVVATGVLGAPLIDRYFLLVAPLLGILLLRVLGSWERASRLRAQRAVAVFGLTGAMFVGAVLVDAAAQVDGARWRIAQGLVAEGIQPSVIDGGDPWFRYHQVGPGRAAASLDGRPWWVAFFPESQACWTIVLTHGLEPGSWGPERASANLQTILGERGRLVVIPGPDSCAN